MCIKIFFSSLIQGLSWGFKKENSGQSFKPRASSFRLEYRLFSFEVVTQVFTIVFGVVTSETTSSKVPSNFPKALLPRKTLAGNGLLLYFYFAKRKFYYFY